jgi:hypothetical protein
MAKIKKAKQEAAKTAPQQKAIAVIATGPLLIIQPNFDVKAGSVITVDPRASGIQPVGNAQSDQATEPATTPAD